jgi:hypothetical protein
MTQAAQSQPLTFSDRFDLLKQRIDAVPRPLLIALVAIAPVLMTYAILTLHMQVRLTNYVPADTNDGVSYYHEILTFSAVGFNSGYYTADENPPPAAPLLRYDAHGPTFPMLYGTAAHFTGWTTYTAIFFNIAILVLCVVAFIRLARLNNFQIAVTGLLLATFWYLIYFIPTSYEETLHDGIAMIVAGVFYILISRDGEVSRRWQAGILILLLVTGLLRISWLLLLFPFLVLVMKPRTPVRVVIAILIASVLLAAIFALNFFLSAPDFYPSRSIVEGFVNYTFEDGMIRLLSVLIYNTKQYLSRTDLLTIVQNLQMVGVVVLAIVMRYRLMASAGQNRATVPPQAIEMMFHFYNVTVIILLALATYLTDGYFRVFAIQLLLSCLLLVAFKHYRAVLVIIATHLLVVGAFLSFMTERLKSSFTHDPAQLATMQESIAPYMVFDPHTENPWCNTVLISPSLFDYRMDMIPAGFGISFLHNRLTPHQPPFNSAFLLFDELTYNTYKDKMHAQLLSGGPMGLLYRNLDADCPLLKPPQRG